MERLRILAKSPVTARAMLAALSRFPAEVLETADGFEVVVALGRDDGEIAAVLNALERYVTEWLGGPARVELNGRTYVMHPKVERRVGRRATRPRVHA